MSSPLITLAALLAGLVAAVLLAASVLPGGRARRGWILAAVIVAVVALGATWPAKLRTSSQYLNSQRVTYAGTAERAAREKCLNDMGRPDLVEALAWARERMPEDARYSVTTTAQSVACVIVNLLPREPVRAEDFDARRHWTVFDQTAPEDLPPRHLAFPPSFVLVPPEEGAR